MPNYDKSDYDWQTMVRSVIWRTIWQTEKGKSRKYVDQDKRRKDYHQRDKGQCVYMVALKNEIIRTI